MKYKIELTDYLANKYNHNVMMEIDLPENVTAMQAIELSKMDPEDVGFVLVDSKIVDDHFVLLPEQKIEFVHSLFAG